MFRICSKCDFEWHSKDGDACPACGLEQKGLRKTSFALNSSVKPTNGIFFNNQKAWVQALAIISMVCFLVLCLSSG